MSIDKLDPDFQKFMRERIQKEAEIQSVQFNEDEAKLWRGNFFDPVVLSADDVVTFFSGPNPLREGIGRRLDLAATKLSRSRIPLFRRAIDRINKSLQTDILDYGFCYEPGMEKDDAGIMMVAPHLEDNRFLWLLLANPIQILQEKDVATIGLWYVHESSHVEDVIAHDRRFPGRTAQERYAHAESLFQNPDKFLAHEAKARALNARAYVQFVGQTGRFVDTPTIEMDAFFFYNYCKGNVRHPLWRDYATHTGFFSPS